MMSYEKSFKEVVNPECDFVGLVYGTGGSGLSFDKLFNYAKCQGMFFIKEVSPTMGSIPSPIKFIPPKSKLGKKKKR